MIKVLVAALVGTIIGIVVMVAVIAIAGTDTSGASSVGLGTLPNSTFTPSGSTGGATTPPPSSGGGSSGPSSSSGGGNAANGKVLFTSKTCSSCQGKGEIKVQQGFFSLSKKCPTCSGVGKVVGDACDVCKGAGTVEQEREFEVSIPADTEDGATRRVAE